MRTVRPRSCAHWRRTPRSVRFGLPRTYTTGVVTHTTVAPDVTARSGALDARFRSYCPSGLSDVVEHTGGEGFHSSAYWQRPSNWKIRRFRNPLQLHNFHRGTRWALVP